MFALRAPGVHYQHLDATRAQVRVRSDVAAFVGVSSRGPIAEPVAVESWRQYEAHFGGVVAGAYLGYAVRGFFENGGRRCRVVRVGARGEAVAAAVLLADADGFTWRVAAASPGTWGDALEVALMRRPRASATTSSRGSRAEYAAVSTTAGFARGALVRAVRPGEVAYRVVAWVDPERSRVYWVAPDPALVLPEEAPLDARAPWRLETVEYDLVVAHRGRIAARLPELSPSRHDPRFGPAIARSPYGDPMRGLDPGDTPPLVVVEAVTERPPGAPAIPDAATGERDARTGARHRLRGGRDGLATLAVEDFIGGGVETLADTGEVAMIAVPDVHMRPEPPPAHAPPPPRPDPCVPCPPPPSPAPIPPPPAPEVPPELSEGEIVRVYAALIALCERRADCVALVDPPRAAAHDREAATRALRSFRRLFDSDYAALFVPWLAVEDGGAGELLRTVPPSGHVAGDTARTDLDTGPHRAAANHALSWARATSLAVDEPVHALLNRDGINVIRSVPGRGIRVMGARTMSSDPSWRYLPVRRQVIVIRETLEAMLQWAVFEPNDHVTRSKVVAVIDDYLRAVWARGALAGAQPEEAFTIDPSEAPEDRDRGRLVVTVGIAPAIPFEFIVLRVGRIDDRLVVTDDAEGRGG